MSCTCILFRFNAELQAVVFNNGDNLSPPAYSEVFATTIFPFRIVYQTKVSLIPKCFL